MDTYIELTDAGVGTRVAAGLTGIPRSSATRADRAKTRDGTSRRPVNRLSRSERAEVVAVLTSDRFVDQAPIQIYATLLDEGRYLCSISTMYRILAENRLVVERRRIARHPSKAIPELVASGPGQVFSWDITKLPGQAKGIWYDAYVMIDIYSRFIVGAHVHSCEAAPLAADMMRDVFDLHGTPQVVHADRGTSMTSKTVARLLADLDITRSLSRPRVSNDNPFSESWFKTLKYAPTFPDRFGCLTDARLFLADFVDVYNHHHRHTGIGLHTPADVHYRHAVARHRQRQETLDTARAEHPERFGSHTTPKIINLPTTTWINPPIEEVAA